MRLPEPSPSQLTEPEAMKALAEALQQAEQLETFAEVVSPPRSALHHSSSPPPHHLTLLPAVQLRHGHISTVSPQLFALAVAAMVVGLLIVLAYNSIACRRDVKRWRKAARAARTSESSLSPTPAEGISTAAVVKPRLPPNFYADGEQVLDLILEHSLAASASLTTSASAATASDLQTRKLARRLPRLASMVCSRWAPKGLAQRARQARKGRELYAARQQRAAALAQIHNLGV